MFRLIEVVTLLPARLCFVMELAAAPVLYRDVV